MFIPKAAAFETAQMARRVRLGADVGKKIYMHHLFEVQTSFCKSLQFVIYMNDFNTRPVSSKCFRREALTNLFLGEDLNPQQRVDSMYKLNSIGQCFQTLKVERSLI